MKVTSHFIKKKVRQLAATAAVRPHRFCPLDEARQVALLVDHNQLQEAMQCMQLLRDKGKKVYGVVWQEGGANPLEQLPSDWVAVSAKADLDLWQIPKSQAQARINALAADILIDLTAAHNHPMQYLLLNHPATFKVGASHAAYDLYDLAIVRKEGEKIADLFANMLFYLQTIRSK
ncbi:MAG: hypothetical protein LUD02_06765 [Tannerellaceae bacterium]|nr:hypothetical protein [Tannerellaceae bacterium]MCD8263883.1 hypothetical protein [Tannerellaceae bacterium]